MNYNNAIQICVAIYEFRIGIRYSQLDFFLYRRYEDSKPLLWRQSQLGRIYKKRLLVFSPRPQRARHWCGLTAQHSTSAQNAVAYKSAKTPLFISSTCT